jgi:hypothetical protein
VNSLIFIHGSVGKGHDVTGEGGSGVVRDSGEVESFHFKRLQRALYSTTTVSDVVTARLLGGLKYGPELPLETLGTPVKKFFCRDDRLVS